MHINLLDVLRCPFCGTRFTLIDNAALARDATHVESGVLGCECCAFPIVAGIPIMIADDPTRAAMHALEAGHRDDALNMLLGLDTAGAESFRQLRRAPEALTYRRAIEILSPDPEGTYFIYRFSDPTFLMAETVLEAVGQNPWAISGAMLDLCGGSGHLTRAVERFRPVGGTTVADLYFWKLWLARQIVTPGSTTVCCDANNPLPFADATFSTVVLSDAFPYIWQKRLITGEMMRVASDPGVVVMPHLHSTLGENVAAGMTLTPEAYRELLAPLSPRLFRDSELLKDAIDRGAVDLTHAVAPAELDGEPSLTIVATRDQRIFRRYDPRPLPTPTGTVVVNPLYRTNRRGHELDLTLAYPTPEYAEEFEESRRYLMPQLTISDATLAAATGPEFESLRRRRILLDVPVNYL